MPPRIILTAGHEIPVAIDDEDSNENHIIGFNGIPSAFRGEKTWLIMNIADLKGYKQIILSANFDYQPSRTNPNECRQNSRVGIWTSVKDCPQVINQASSSYSYPHGSSDKVQVNLKEWGFGKKSEICFEINDGRESDVIQLAMCAIPYFQVEGKEFPITELKIKLEGMPNHAGHYEEIETKVIEFNQKSDVRTPGLEFELQLFHEFGAFNQFGDGNSVHPKQLFTIRALEEFMGQNKSNDLSLAYIGTDTTENLRSLLRCIFDEKTKYYDRIKKFTVYFTEEWDRQLIEEFPELEIRPGYCEGKFELKLEKLPIEGSLPQSVLPVDLVISTYVTPWAIEGEKNKQQYVDLINSLMDNQSGEIISVDPSDSTKMIRSACELTNLQDVYLNDLGLKMKRNLSSGRDKVVDCKLWSKNMGRVEHLQ